MGIMPKGCDTRGYLLELQNLKVERNAHEDPRVVDVNIHIEGKPFGRVAFQNVALGIGESWFLRSPEPGGQAASREKET